MALPDLKAENNELRLKLQAAMSRIAELEGAGKTTKEVPLVHPAPKVTHEKKVDHGHKPS